MASFTASQPQYNGAGFTNTYDSQYLGNNVEQSITGLDPDGIVGLFQVGGNGRVAFSPDVSGYTTSYESQYLGNDVKQTVNGIQPDSIVRLGSTSNGEYQSYISEEAAYTIQHNLSGPDSQYISDGVDYSRAVAGFSTLDRGLGSVVPTAYFRRVSGVVTDNQGEIIRNANYIVSLDNFGVVGQVDDSGVFDIYLLRQTYSDFMIVVDEGKKEGVDIVWYESEGAEVSIYDESKQLTFDTSQTLSGGGGGLQVGGGVNLG